MFQWSRRTYRRDDIVRGTTVQKCTLLKLWIKPDTIYNTYCKHLLDLECACLHHRWAERDMCLQVYCIGCPPMIDNRYPSHHRLSTWMSTSCIVCRHWKTCPHILGTNLIQCAGMVKGIPAAPTISPEGVIGPALLLSRPCCLGGLKLA